MKTITRTYFGDRRDTYEAGEELTNLTKRFKWLIIKVNYNKDRNRTNVYLKRIPI